MNTPKFKIGDRVKMKDSEGQQHLGTISCDMTDKGRWLIQVPGVSGGEKISWWHESHLSLNVPETPKFKLGDRVKWGHFGKPLFGFVRAHISDGWWKVEYTAGCMANFHESGISLDAPEPKQFATKLEAELGAEIIKLHYDAAYLDARLTKEIGERHRERIAKEAAQRELAEANDKIKRLIGAQFDLSGVCATERIAKEAAQKKLAKVFDILSPPTI